MMISHRHGFQVTSWYRILPMSRLAEYGLRHSVLLHMAACDSEYPVTIIEFHSRLRKRLVCPEIVARWQGR